jgi:cephalosporin-C deacetylase
VQGYLAKPGKPGKYPAVITYEWAGVHQLNPGTVLGPARDGWIAMNVDSHDLPPYEDKAAPEVMDYANQFPNDREKNYFLNMFLRDSRAVDYIASLPEWDGKTILVRGGSLGGWQGLVTAGLNPHVTHVLVEDPVGTDLNGARHGRTTAHPYWNSTNPEIAKTTPYFDAVNFSTRSHAITLSAIGFIDRSAPASGVWAALNAIHAPTEPILMQERTHDQGQSPWTDQPSRIRSAEVMDLLHLGKPLVVHEPEGTNKHE